VISATPISDAERPRFLTDEDFNLAIVTGLRRVRPQIDILTLQSAKMPGAADPLVLALAKEQDRILLSYDRQTMPAHFATYLMSMSEGEHSPGIPLLAQETPIGAAIQWILEIWEASRHVEWRNLLTWLPL
jgi:hypothetical protein